MKNKSNIRRPSLTESQRLNRAKWQVASRDFRQLGEQCWSTSNPTWGLWQRSDEEIKLLPEDLTGLTCLDVGSGSGYILKWMTERGAYAIGLEPTDNQIVTAQGFSIQFGTSINMVQGFAEQLPFADNSVDFAISEYGAVLWADPYDWIPEIARVLKPGASLVLFLNHMLSYLTDNGLDPPEGQWTDTLQRSYFSAYRTLWNEDGSDGIEFHLPPGEWIKLFRSQDLVIDAMLELGAPANAHSPFSYASSEWGEQWPAELVWKVHKS